MAWVSLENLQHFYNKLKEKDLSSSTTLDKVYPVGSIYMSVSATSPATLFGGTWEQLKDTFLLACGDTYENGATGGEAEHTLTVDEMPSHNHSYTIRGNSAPTGTGNKWSYWENSASATTGSTGGDQAHNNMPPYLAVYMWKRTA